MAGIQELLIKIGLKADTSGATQAAGAIDGVGKSADNAAKANKDLAKGIGAQVEVSGAAISMFQNLERASQGGAQGLIGAANAVRNFGTMLKTTLIGAGPIGIAVTVLATLAGAVLALKDAFKPAGESAEEMAKKIETANKAKLDAVKKEIEDVGKAAGEAVARIDKINQSVQKVGDARLSADKAVLDAQVKSGKITQEQADARLKALQREREDQKAIAEIETERKKAQVLDDQATLAGAKALSTAREFQESIATRENLASAGKRLETAQRNARGVDVKETPAAEAQAVFDELSAARKAYAEAQRTAGPNIKATIENNDERQKVAAKAFEEAAEKARKAWDDLALKVATQSAVDQETSRRRAAEDNKPLGVTERTSGGRAVIDGREVLFRPGARTIEAPTPGDTLVGGKESSAAKAVNDGAGKIAQSLEKAGSEKPDLSPAVAAAKSFSEQQTGWNAQQAQILQQQAASLASAATIISQQKQDLQALKQKIDDVQRQMANLRK